MVVRVCPSGHEVHAPAGLATVWCPRCGVAFAVAKQVEKERAK